MAKKRIPVVIVAGFLGSGKTTLLNHVLRNNRGVRVGVIVNDFGAVNIDSMMVAGQVDSMVSLSNGCMCCAVDVSDMDEMLDRLAHPSSQIDVIIVEASGLAEPRNMIRLVLGSTNPHVVYGGLVVMVDGEQFEDMSAQHPDLGKHVTLADLVILNKTDRIDDARRAAVQAMVRDYNDRAPVLTTAHGRIEPTLLFDREPGREPAAGEQLTLDQLLLDQHDHCGDHDHLHSSYEAVDFASDDPIDPRRLVEFLEKRPVGIYRIKGFVHFAVPGQSRKFEVQTVGPHIRFTSTRWEPGEERATQLVLIGADIEAGRADPARGLRRGGGRRGGPRRDAGCAPLYRDRVTESACSPETNPEPALSVYDAIRRRRDVRAEFTGEPIASDVLDRILGAAHCAPSVGNTQPWDFVVVRDTGTLTTFADHVAGARRRFAESLPEDRKKTFDPIKIEGICESGMGVVVTYDRSRGGEHILGRHTVDDTGLFSAVLAIQNLWLAAAAENVGVGWVSFYDEPYLTELLGIPEPVRPIAWLCVGKVAEFQQVPDLERFGWRGRRPLADAVHLEKF